MPLPQSLSSVPSNYLWFVDENFNREGTLYRLDKNSMTLSPKYPVDLPQNIRAIRYKHKIPSRSKYSSNTPIFSRIMGDISSTLFSDDEHIWIGIVLPRAWEGLWKGQPHILKISKNNMKYELTAIKQTSGDSIRNASQNIRDIFDYLMSWTTLIGFIFSIILLTVYIAISQRVRKKISFFELIGLSCAIGFIYVIWCISGATGESGLIAFGLAPSIFAGFLIGGVLMAIIYKMME